MYLNPIWLFCIRGCIYQKRRTCDKNQLYSTTRVILRCLVKGHHTIIGYEGDVRTIRIKHFALEFSFFIVQLLFLYPWGISIAMCLDRILQVPESNNVMYMY